jgi:hypothetical protein
LQLAVSLVAAFSTVASGMSLGFSAIALPELLRAESPDHLDIDQASWFGKALCPCGHETPRLTRLLLVTDACSS